jgi:hypothetical protein
MGDDATRREVLLAVALGTRRKRKDRRGLPDRRSGIDRRKDRLPVGEERRSGGERRQVVRRKTDQDEGPTLLEKARNRLSAGFQRRTAVEDSRDGLR